VARALLKILSHRVDSLSVSGWDVWIQPRLGREGMMDFDSAAELMEAGHRAACGQMDRIRALFPPGTLPVRAAQPSLLEIERRLGPLSVAWVGWGAAEFLCWVPKRELPSSRGSLHHGGAGSRAAPALRHQSLRIVWPQLALVDSSRVGVTLELEERAPVYVSVGSSTTTAARRM